MTTRPLSSLTKENGVRFGTSGVRGLVQDLTDELCFAFTHAFLQGLPPATEYVVLGMDLRPSSPRMAMACAAAIQAHGKKVINVGVLPTPALAFFALSESLPAVMITGSHIPFDRNGIKFYSAMGEISKADEQAICEARVPTAADWSTTLPPVESRALQLYRERYTRFFPAFFLRGTRIGVYQHSGVARDLLCDLLAEFGAHVVPLGRTEDFVPVDTEAVSHETAQRGRQWAAEHRLDALVSTDGDADRPLLGDENGVWLRGDIVGLLCAKYVGARTVVTPVSSNTAIERCGLFDRVVRTRIGSPYVVGAMESLMQGGAPGVVGFEANGGFLQGTEVVRGTATLTALPTRDAMLPILALLALAREHNTPLSALQADLPTRFTASDRVQNFPVALSHALLDQWKREPDAFKHLFGLDSAEHTDIDLTDGLRMTLADGRIVHVRPSGNAPELRCYVETDSSDSAATFVRENISILQALRDAHA